jgi:hypothetical protein
LTAGHLVSSPERILETAGRDVERLGNAMSSATLEKAAGGGFLHPGVFSGQQPVVKAVVRCAVPGAAEYQIASDLVGAAVLNEARNIYLEAARR